MACACKVNQQIDYLHKKYGDNIPKSKKTNIASKLEVKFENGLIYLLFLPALPIMIAFIVYKSFTKKTIHLDKLLKLRKK